MKKIHLFTAFILLASILSSNFSVSASTRAPKILVAGDSISSGYGLEGYPDGIVENYGRLFASSVGSLEGDSYINLSVDGETSAGLLWRIENSPKTVFSGFDAVIVSSGGNDLIDSLLPSVISIIAEFSGGSYRDADLLVKLNLASEKFFSTAKKTGEDVYRNLSSALSALRKQNPSAYLAVLSIYDPFDDNSNKGALKLIDKALIAPCIDLLNSYIKKSAEENGFDYIDVDSLFSGRAGTLTNIKSLDIHPNAEGHLLISDGILKSYRDFKSKDAFLEIGYPRDKDSFARTALGIATIAGATLFGCASIVISFGKYRVKLKDE
ncbi:MAG: SGNH/GDSL hydrolase family protein [Ruminococcaceae bacterium]|nr:SGNH/GDSL hydrolase family protein [Oscillospiraceae bacterium]